MSDSASSSHPQKKQAPPGSFINTGTQNIINSVVNLGKIAEDVRINIGKLESTSNPKVKGIKELLEDLRIAIFSSPELPESTKKIALEKVDNLVNAWNNPNKEEKKNLAQKAMSFLGGMLLGFPKLLEGCDGILKAISELFGDDNGQN